METKNIAGMSMKGGRNDNFYLCLLEYFPDHQRWALKSFLTLKDETDREDAIRNWIEEFKIKELVLDFPLSLPACSTCTLDCPGIHACPVESVVSVKGIIDELLSEDQKIYEKSPKSYEKNRNREDEVDRSRDFFRKESSDHLLSRSFKRRLKKGYLPYWNRPIDLWIWNYYYDQLLELFNIGYDSFGNTSLMIQSRFSYLRRHFPKDLKLFETFGPLIQIELLRSKVIHKRHIQNYNDMEIGIDSRVDLINEIILNANLFIYDHDFEILVRNPHAFDSFLLALAGMRVQQGGFKKLPSWALSKENNYLIPSFSSLPHKENT